jgi:mRNA interferase YafQ
MKRLSWHTSFRRAFKRQTKKDPALQERIFEVLEKLSRNPFDAELKTHKLSGQLKGLWACWVEYDCRIIFTFTSDPETKEELIALIDLGTHDEVY